MAALLADISVPPECRDTIRAGALVAIDTSGGKDSKAMTILLSRIVPRDRLVAVHAPLAEVESPGNGLSLCVFWVYEPSRSFPEAKRTKEQVRDALMPYTKAYTMPAGIEDLRLHCGLSLRLVHIQPTEDPASFVFGGFSGMTGRHVWDKLLNGLARTVTRKSSDISNRGDHFDTWWLVLIDRVFSSENFTFDGTKEGKRLLIAMKSIIGELAGAEGHSWPWSRIIVLEPSVLCRGHILVNEDGLGGSNN